MPFQKNNQLGAKKIYDVKLDTQPISFRGRSGQREKLKSLPGWQEYLRDCVDAYLAQSGQNTEIYPDLSRN